MWWKGSVCVNKTGFLSTQLNSHTSRHWLAIAVTSMWRAVLRKWSYGGGEEIKWQVAYFLLPNHFPLPSPLPSCAHPHTLSIAEQHRHTQPTETISIPLLLHTLSLCCLGSSFGWSTLIAMGHSLSLALRSKKNPSLLIHQTSTCQTLAQEEKTSVSFLFFSLSPPFSLFSPRQITVMSRRVRRERWSAIRPPFPITQWALGNPPEHACTVEVSHHSCTSMTDTVATQ